jgi:hypothetical protein
MRMPFSDSDLMKVIPETSHACTLNFLVFIKDGLINVNNATM